MRAPFAVGFIVLASLAFVGRPAEAARAAHPCMSAIDPELRVVGTPRAGRLTVVRSDAPAFSRFDWGDGTPVRSRTTRPDGTLRHRYRRAGRYTIVATQLVSACCDASHETCTPASTVKNRLRIRVRARR